VKSTADVQAERVRPSRAWIVALLFAIACVVIGAVLGDSYIGRLPNHAGYFLVAVDDAVRTPPAMRPRHTAFIVVDGLRRDSAEAMLVTRKLEAAGQCRISDQGSFTVSRPEYALLSTGIEVDRSGSRNNDLTAPLAAESIWQVARRNGLQVGGSSHLPWFRQLFPEGFDRFNAPPLHAENVFGPSKTGQDLLDLNVFHPLYVDEAGHEHGGASVEYNAAVARADGEIARLLARMDLERDLVILTADHGHRDSGGHGGSQPVIREVLVCFAGPNVARRTDRAGFDGRSTAPTLAVLLGLPFPRQMRAVEDGLDVLWDIVDAKAVGAPYIEDRRYAVDRFRDANRKALEGWLGGPREMATWSRLYAREAGAQTTRALIALAVTLVGLGIAFRLRRALPKEIVFTTAWLAFALCLIWAIHRAALGDFDFTVINRRERFIRRGLMIALSASLFAVAAHALAFRSLTRLVADYLTFLGILLVANVGHILVYGWPIGFPLPPTAARYFPFFGAIALVAFGLVGVALVIVGRWKRSAARLAAAGAGEHAG
jgi:hypothetical protein